MAKINEGGNITARCPGCFGATSTFEWQNSQGGVWGGIPYSAEGTSRQYAQYRLFRCAGCGRGALGFVAYGNHPQYPGAAQQIVDFYEESGETMVIPKLTPKGIAREFREAETCLAQRCYRAAAGLFRSVLDKTLRANGYKSVGNLKNQIDAAADDGVITAARKRRAHDEIRVLGNDVLHDDWIELGASDVELAHMYAQRILEDFYDDRTSVEHLLTEAKRSFESVIKAA